MKEKYFGVDFYKDKFTRLDGTAVLNFTADEVAVQPFRLTCTREGVNFSGTLNHPISSARELSDLARLFADAWKEHKKLAPKVSPSGVIE